MEAGVSDSLGDLTYWVEPPTAVERFFSTAGAWEGVVDFSDGDDHVVIPMVLFSDGEGHGFGVKQEARGQ